MYGTDPKIGLSSSNLPDEILKDINSEKELKDEITTSEEMLPEIIIQEEEKAVKKNRTESFNNQSIAAKKMKLSSNGKFQKLPVGSPIVVSVPKIDRGPLDDRNITAFIVDERHGLYKVGTGGGVIKN
ncbi:hypothetical protein ABEB36_008326 [Hypothenemus hampei]|uniref:Uncharacterized protein n=1 Tax=Hypothenemus hampei TaxID=57062 RepID=A0ABD1ELG6_HYPHA